MGQKWKTDLFKLPIEDVNFRFAYHAVPTLLGKRETLGDPRVDYETLVARILDNQRYLKITAYVWCINMCQLIRRPIICVQVGSSGVEGL